MRIKHIVAIGLFAVLALPSAFGQLSVFATGMTSPESITNTAAGNFLITDANGSIWSVPAGGGSATQLATTAPESLRSGLILPDSFTAVAGQFIVFGGDATTNGAGFAGTMPTTSPFTVSTYATQSNSLWSQSVLAPSFGSFSGDILVANQGSGTGTKDGSVDFFSPSGTVGKVTALSAVNVPFGAALAPASFAHVGGMLLVSDAGGSGIYAVSNTADVSSFTTISFHPAQGGLRQMAFAPKGFGTLGNDLFVSRVSGEIDVLNRDGVVIGAISGSFAARGMLFTTISGKVTLLFADISSGRILAAGPGDVVSVPH